MRLIPVRKDRGAHRSKVAVAAIVGRGWAAHKANRVGIDGQDNWSSPSRHVRYLQSRFG